MHLRCTQSLADHLDLLPRCRDSAFGLLLESMEDVHRVLEKHRVNCPEGVAIVVIDHLEDARAGESLQWPGAARFAASLVDEQCPPDDTLHVTGK